MAKLTRVTQVVFGSSAGFDQIAQFGSLAAGSPNFTTNVGSIMALSNWAAGWFDAVEAGNAPAIEDDNAYAYATSYQIGYILQQGVPEYDSATTYYTHSLALGSDGNLYQSLTDSNTNNNPTSGSPWSVFVRNSPNKVISASSGAFTTTVNGLGSVTNLIGSITTTGNPVIVFLTGDGPEAAAPSQIGASTSVNAFVDARFQLKRGTSNVFNTRVNSSGYPGGSSINLGVPPSSFYFIDTPAAGTYVYSVQAGASSASQTTFVTNCVLVIYELH